MSESLPVDLPVAPLPLTSIQRDELEQAILKRVRGFLGQMLDPSEDTLDLLCETIVRRVMDESNLFLTRENLKNVLRVDYGMIVDELHKHPQVRDIIRKACETRSNFTRIADLKIFQIIPESGNAPAHDKDQPAFLYESFVRPYIGKAVDGFYEYLNTTFPFLHEHPEVAKLLHGLVSRQQEVPSQSFKRLEALVKFGSTATLRHSRWETQDVM